MNAQLTKKIDYSYSTGGVYQGKLFYGKTVVGSFDTSPSMNIDLVWNDSTGQFLLQDLNSKFSKIDSRDLTSAVYNLLKKR